MSEKPTGAWNTELTAGGVGLLDLGDMVEVEVASGDRLLGKATMIDFGDPEGITLSGPRAAPRSCNVDMWSTWSKADDDRSRRVRWRKLTEVSAMTTRTPYSDKWRARTIERMAELGVNRDELSNGTGLSPPALRLVLADGTDLSLEIAGIVDKLLDELERGSDPACPCCGSIWGHIDGRRTQHIEEIARLFARYRSNPEFRREVMDRQRPDGEVAWLPDIVEIDGRRYEGERAWVFACLLCGGTTATDLIVAGDEVAPE